MLRPFFVSLNSMDKEGRVDWRVVSISKDYVS